MNNHIVNIEDTFQNLLSKEHYFFSLLQVLRSNNLLNIGELERIQLQMADILTEIVGYYTKDNSSSVRVETAEQLMLSIYYTIGLFLKSRPTIKEAISLVKEKDLKYLFSQGEEILKAKAVQCKRLYELAKETQLKTKNYTYIDTLGHGVSLFFKEYDIRFASHETPGSIDYPLADDKMDLVGIEYIDSYLNKVILENKFCSYFDSTEIEELLKGFSRNCNHMVINIFQLVLTNSLGNILLGKDGRSLNITEADRLHLRSKLKIQSGPELEQLIYQAAERLCQEYFIEDKSLIEYINGATSIVVQEIRRCILTDTLGSIFFTLDKSEKNTINYEDGESLNNSLFRNITEEIRDCETAQEKLEIIREELHSLKDLVDVLSADCIFDDEFIYIFKALEDFEIALLVRSISKDENFDNDYGTESEKEWHKELKTYLDSLDEIKRGKIISLSKGIEL